MAVNFKKGRKTAVGMQVTDSQNDTVGIVVWAASEGHNLNQVTSGGAVLPALPATESEEAVPVVQWGWVLITEDGTLAVYQSSDELAGAGWKTVEEPAPEPS